MDVARLEPRPVGLDEEARTPSAVCAHTTASCARLPLVIQHLVPLSSHTSPRRTARVRMPETWLPKSGTRRLVEERFRAMLDDFEFAAGT